MKVLITSPTFPPFNSGLGNAVQQQAKGLVNAGCEVVVCTGGERRDQYPDIYSGALVEQFAVSGAQFAFNPIRGDAQGYVRFLTTSRFDLVLMNAWQNWATDLALENLASIAGRKMVYSHCLSTNLLVAERTIRSWVKYVAWRPYWFRLPRRMRALDGLVFLAADGCDCRFDDLRLARKLKLPYSVVPNALSPASVALLEGAPTPLQQRRELIAIGSYDWFKGHDFVLRAYAASALKNKVRLNFFGQRFTRFTTQLQALAQGLGLDSKYLGFHEGASGAALLAECARARLLVSGSVTECQPLVLLDSLAAGTPFIARATGCIPSMAGGKSVETEEQAAQVLSHLWQDDSAWQVLSDAGRKLARQQHHPDAVTSALLVALGLPVNTNETSHA